MVKKPVVVGLVICKEVIIDETTHHKTLVNCVREVRADEFPTEPQDYTVCCILADGLGEADVRLQVLDLLTSEVVYTNSWRVRFADSLQEFWLIITAEKVAFPGPARFEFALFIDGEWFAHNTVSLIRK